MDRRRTGRTTRMLEAATKEAISGKPVVVIYGSAGERPELLFSLQRVLADVPGGPEAFARIKLVHVRDPMVDLDHPTMYRGHLGPVFVDHHAVEVKIGHRMVELLLAWDLHESTAEAKP